MSNESQLIGNR